MKKVVLISGGIDSMVAACGEFRDGHSVSGLFFHYGQKNSIEVLSALRVSRLIGIKDVRIELLPSVPVGGSEIDSTAFAPGRNAMMLIAAGIYASSIGASSVVFGANADDAKGFPDCREDFFESMRGAFRLSGLSIGIETPLIYKTKAEVVSIGFSMGVPIEETLSCYNPNDKAPCGVCGACLLRDAALAEYERERDE